MAVDRRAADSGERWHEGEQRRPWETPVLRELPVGVGTASKPKTFFHETTFTENPTLPPFIGNPS